MLRIKCLRYNAASQLEEIDLGAAPEGVKMPHSFSWRVGDTVHDRCYVEEEPENLKGWWAALRYAAFAVSGSVVCWLIFTVIHWLGAL